MQQSALEREFCDLMQGLLLQIGSGILPMAKSGSVLVGPQRPDTENEDETFDDEKVVAAPPAPIGVTLEAKPFASGHDMCSIHRRDNDPSHLFDQNNEPDAVAWPSVIGIENQPLIIHADIYDLRIAKGTTADNKFFFE